MEEQLITMFRNGLPVSVQIALAGDHYCWHVLDGDGTATGLIEATRQALTSLFTQIAADSIIAGTTSGKHNTTDSRDNRRKAIVTAWFR